MNEYPRISIVTPSYNQGSFLERTIKSVLDQGYPNLDYIIIDGGSTDLSVSIIKQYQDQLSFWVSEKDKGLYDALSKGFRRSSGEIMGWINSDDILQKNSLFTVAEIFKNKEIRWVQGYPNAIDESDRVLYTRKPRWNKFEFYNKKYIDRMFVQQESTYWRRDLWEQAGSEISTKYKFASDFELWLNFFQYAELYVTNAMLGSFRVRKTGQISSTNFSEYLEECHNITDEYVSKLSVKNAKRLRQLNSRPVFSKLVSLIPPLERRIIPQEHPKIVTYNFQDSKFEVHNTAYLKPGAFSNL